MPLKKATTALFIIIPLIAITVTAYLSHKLHGPEHVMVSESVMRGKSMAFTWCRSCHMLPDPSLLDKKSWLNGVLPAMGPRLGIFSFNGKSYRNDRYDHHVARNFYPDSARLTPAEWQDLINYYVSNAPDSLSKQHRAVPIKNDLDLFTVLRPEYRYENPASCMVKIDTLNGKPKLFISDVIRQQVMVFDSRLHLIDSVKTRGPVVHLDIKAGHYNFCNIGIINPNNEQAGTVDFRKSRILNKQADIPLFDSLSRPVQVTEQDLNADGKPDYLVCEFGNLTGSLSWFENTGGKKFVKHVLRAFPGSVQTYVTDYNKDGLPDIWALFAQGEEGIFLFTNKGNGNFEEKEVLRFPPVFGSSSFQLVDMNHDGFPDIIYTCGDNADQSRILKPYHGVYLFLNNGKNDFSQTWFYPINGCYKAIAADFDGDGKEDIATIAFFPDYPNQPEEGFVYFRNEGNNQFTPHSLPEGTEGRWLTMDAGDVDGDGKTDLILGNLSVGPVLSKSSVNWKKNAPFLVLKKK